jgi:hypothetical protein
MLVKDLCFVYHRWNMIAEPDQMFTTDSGPSRTRVVRRQLWEAEGVGGLRAVSQLVPAPNFGTHLAQKKPKEAPKR